MQIDYEKLRQQFRLNPESMQTTNPVWKDYVCISCYFDGKTKSTPFTLMVKDNVYKRMGRTLGLFDPKVIKRKGPAAFRVISNKSGPLDIKIETINDGKILDLTTVIPHKFTQDPTLIRYRSPFIFLAPNDNISITTTSRDSIDILVCEIRIDGLN